MEPITRKELFMAKAAGENVNVPEPITREEKYLKYMADNSVSKYFGESTEVLFDQRVELANEGYVLSEALAISDGDHVKVTWDGTEYECTAVQMQMDADTTAVVVGNIYGEGSAPFVIAVIPSAGMTQIVESSGFIGVIPVKIEKSVIHTIDPKFLPGKVVYYWDKDANTATDANGNEITVEQAKKDAFNVVIFDVLDGEAYYFPTSVILKDTYVEIRFWKNGGETSVNFGEAPR